MIAMQRHNGMNFAHQNKRQGELDFLHELTTQPNKGAPSNDDEVDALIREVSGNEPVVSEEDAHLTSMRRKYSVRASEDEDGIESLDDH